MASARNSDQNTFTNTSVMDLHSIGDQGVSAVEPTPPLRVGDSGAFPKLAAEKLRFPGEDGGRSLTEMAQRDLYAALQLLAERAQYITGASGAAIALREDTEMICRASAGSSAPELGAHLQVNSGLSGESVRTRQTLRCDNAETDPRVNRDSCRVLGIASVVVMPLAHDGEVNGVFELLSDRAYAFEDRDLTALERLAEMVQTALSHAQAARQAEAEILGKPAGSVSKQVSSPPEVKADLKNQNGKSEPEAREQLAKTESKTEVKISANPDPPAQKAAELGQGEQIEESPGREVSQLDLSAAEIGNIRKCESCGFPVSEGRKTCLDCEASNHGDQPSPAFLSPLNASEQSWLRSHLYLIGTILVAVLTIAVLLWFVR
jgi:putative methionine-R-sulfoxide reductase with GAF domain